MTVTLRQLSYFIALAEEHGFGRAAERVHVSQPALSVQIRELEQDLGAQLVERLPRGMRLTPIGREVLEHAYRIQAEVGVLEAVTRRAGALPQLNLGVIPTVAPYLLPPVLAALRQDAAAGEIRVREAQTTDLMKGLDDGRLDAAVIAMPHDIRPDLVAHPLVEDRFLLAGAPVTLARLPDPERLRPVALDPRELLLLDEGHCLADQALEVCGLKRTSARVDLGASSLATLCGLVAEEFGLTFLPELALKSEQAAAPGMAVRRFATPEPMRRIAVVRRGGGRAPWFETLAGRLAEAGEQLIAHARATVPVA